MVGTVISYWRFRILQANAVEPCFKYTQQRQFLTLQVNNLGMLAKPDAGKRFRRLFVVIKSQGCTKFNCPDQFRAPSI